MKKQIENLAKDMKELKKCNGKIALVAGPVVIHTGADVS